MPKKDKVKFGTTTVEIDFDEKDFRERILKLLAFLEKHCDKNGTSDYVNAGEVESYIIGGFGQENPEDEIQIGEERN